MNNYKTAVLTRAASLLSVVVLSLLGAKSEVRAADPDPNSVPPPPPRKWESVVTAGASLTRGNSKTFLGNVSLNTKRNWTNDELLFGANAGYGENTTAGVKRTTDSYIKGFGQWNHLFTPQFYAGLRVAGEHDDIAALAYRVIISPLAGYYFIKNATDVFSVEAGPSYIREKFFGESEDDFIALRIAEKYEHKFANGAKIWEGVEFLPKVEDFGNYLVNAEAGISAPISKALSLSLVAQDSYKSRPANGKLKNDFKLIAGLSYNF